MVTINTLNGGNITITTGGSAPTEHAETIFTFTGNRTVSKNITGELGESTWTVNDDTEETILDYEGQEDLSKYELVSIDIGNTVTSISSTMFDGCSGLTSVTIPDSVTCIGEYAFCNCASLTSVTFLGRTMEQVLGIEDENKRLCYPWSINDINAINVA